MLDFLNEGNMLDFLNEENKEKYNNLDDEQKEIFDKLMFRYIFSIVMKGVNPELYSETMTEMQNLLIDFQTFLEKTDFTNKDLQILKSLFQQGRNIIKSLIEEKKDV